MVMIVVIPEHTGVVVYWGGKIGRKPSDNVEHGDEKKSSKKNKTFSHGFPQSSSSLEMMIFFGFYF